MPRNARDTYFETQVVTATPQRLRLMLIDGALRFAHQAIECWDDQVNRVPRYNALTRCHDIVVELYRTIRADDLPLAAQVKAIYAYLIREMALASTATDCQPVRNVVKVLEEERVTWQRLCEIMPEPPQRDNAGPQGCREITARECPPARSSIPAPLGHANLPQDRLSLEA
ncbi:MAG: flagellar export chaperone FliS [Pirellulaceae bacterium]